MKVGDLICYNAAGMRAKTIGVYMGMKKVPAPYIRSAPHITVYKILWLVFGEVMPRAVLWHPADGGTYAATLVKTENYSGLHYHEDHGCFELIKKSS